MPFGRYAESSAFAERALARHGGPQATDLNNPNQRVKMLSINDLSEKTVKQLRQLARELNCATGDQRERANKAQLIEWIIKSKKVIQEQANQDFIQESQDFIDELEEEKESFDAKQAPAPVQPAPVQTEKKSDDLASMLASALEDHLKPQAAQMDEGRVIELIKQHSEAPEAKTVNVQVADQKSIELERQHWLFPLLLTCAANNQNALLVGPAGTGKTYAANMVARALERGFEALSVGPLTTEAKLLGYMDANGKYHDTALVRCASNGNVFLMDEIDAGNAGVITVANMVLANDQFAVPTGMRAKHQDFVFIAGANTFGTGANRQYVGRNQLDAATLDRFAVINWNYDDGLEAARVGMNIKSPVFNMDKGGTVTPEQWYIRARAMRNAVDKLKMRHVIGRAVVDGAKLASAGVGLDWLDSMFLQRGLDEADFNKLKTEAGV